MMLRGDLPAVAALALSEGSAGLGALRLEVGRPVAPMLASTAADLGAALSRIVPAAVEWKLDGARIQVHRDGEDVQIFSRTLDEVTPRLPEVVAAVRALPARSLVLDGEVIALAQDGRPRPFRVTAGRFGARRDVEALRRATPLTAFLFDVLHRDGADLLDAPGSARAEHLAALAPPGLRVPRVLADDLAGAQAVLDDALARGHEGVMVKSLDAPYAAGRRGSEWLKVKPVHTLDLVVLAAEWGHGRRRGFLSNLHLGARGGAGWAMLGKTFKGLTDALLAPQTERLLALEERRDSHTVHVRPELVVEIACDGVQLSTRYASGSPCASPASSATGRTSPPPRPTRSTRCARWRLRAERSRPRRGCCRGRGTRPSGVGAALRPLHPDRARARPRMPRGGRRPRRAGCR